MRAFTSRSALPSEWDRRHWGRHQHVQEYLKVEGLTVKYIGPGETDQQAATVFADHPVPQDVPLYYFEVTIVNKGDSGYIGIGFCTDTVNLGRLPGWEAHSYGYHGDDGHAFHGSGQGRAFGPGFTTGDVVGTLLDRARNTISYYKNGAFVGTAFYDVKEQHLYPCVGMRTKHEEVRANFGAAPFAVDLKKLQVEFRDRVLNNIYAMQLPATVELKQQQPQLPSTTTTTAAAAAGDVQAYIAAVMAAVDSERGTSGSGTQLPPESAAAAAVDGRGSSSSQPPAGSNRSKVSQPLTPYLVFNYLLHTRCWRTAVIVAQELLASSSAGGSSAAAATAAAAAAAATTAAGGAGGDAGPVAMEVSGGGAAEDHPMPDAPAAGGSLAAAAAAAAGTAAEEEGRDGQRAGPQAAAAAASGSSGGCSSNGVAALGTLSEADIQDALRRQQIYDAVCKGQIADGMAAVQANYGAEILEANPRLAFKLRVQQFIELVRQAQQPPPAQASNGSSATEAAAAAASSSSSTGGFEAALAYGRAELGPGSKSPEDEELLSDALSLLAYADPGASPCGHLLRDSYRADLAEELNGALLKARGSSGRPVLESVYRQAVVLVDELKRNGLPAALVLDVPGLCFGSNESRQ